MPSGPEEEDSLDVDRAAGISAVVMGPETGESSSQNVRNCDDRLLSVHRHKILKTSIIDIQYNPSNTMTGEGEEKQGLHGTR